jgi:hypothetical protein
MENRSVCHGVKGDCLGELASSPKEDTIFCVVFHLCAIQQKIVVSCLLRPMLGRQKAHPQTKYL